MESLARYTYNIERRAHARARVQERKRLKAHGNTKPSDTGKKGVHKRTKKKVKVGGLLAGDLGEAAFEDLAKEIEGTGGYGPGDVRFSSAAAVHEFPGIPSSVRLRFSHLTDINFGKMLEKVRAIYDKMEQGEGKRPASRPDWL